MIWARNVRAYGSARGRHDPCRFRVPGDGAHDVGEALERDLFVEVAHELKAGDDDIGVAALCGPKAHDNVVLSLTQLTTLTFRPAFELARSTPGCMRVVSPVPV